jgi:glycosyltransferase involved in cell wall biosynthesis
MMYEPKEEPVIRQDTGLGQVLPTGGEVAGLQTTEEISGALAAIARAGPINEQHMTICLVSQDYPPGGGGGICTQTFLKAHALADLGHSVHVIAATYENSERTDLDGQVTVHRIVHPEGYTPFSEPSVHWVAYSWLVARKIYELLEEISFDLIEFPEYGAEGFIYLIDAHQYHNIPVVVMLHGSLAMCAERMGWPEVGSDFRRFGEFMEETVVRRADLLLAASHNIARFWAGRCGISLEDIAVPHIAVDSTKFVPPATAESSRPTILFVGRVQWEKGVFAAAEAVLRLKDTYPDILFRIVGAGDEDNLKHLHEMIEEAGARENFEVLGELPHSELPKYYAGCDVFASPGPIEHGVATVNLEAMSCGRPVVACTTGGPQEAVIDGEMGLLVPPGDIDALARALNTLLADGELRDRLGRNGRRRVLDYFSLDKHVARVEEAYNSLLEAPRLEVSRGADDLTETQPGLSPALEGTHTNPELTV